MTGRRGRGAVRVRGRHADGDAERHQATATARRRPIRTVRRPNVFALVGDNLWVAGFPVSTQDRIDIRTWRVARSRARAGPSAAGSLVTGTTWWLALANEQRMVELDGRSGRVLREVRFPVGRPKAIVRLGATLWVGLGAVTADGPGFARRGES